MFVTRPECVQSRACMDVTGLHLQLILWECFPCKLQQMVAASTWGQVEEWEEVWHVSLLMESRLPSVDVGGGVFNSRVPSELSFVAARAGGGEWGYMGLWMDPWVFRHILLETKSTAVRCGLSVQDCLQKHSELLGLSQPYGTAVDVNGKSRADIGLHHLQRNGLSAGGFWRGSAPTLGGGEVEITWSEVSCVGQCRFSRGGVGSGEDLSLLLSSRGPDPIRSPVLFLPLCISEPIKFRFAEVHFVIHSFQARDWLFIFLDTIKAQYLKQISTQLFSLDSLNGALKSKINSAVAERYISAFLSGFAKFF